MQTVAIIVILFGIYYASRIDCEWNWKGYCSPGLWHIEHQDDGVCDEGHRGDEDFICVRPLRRKDCFKEKWIVENISGTKTPKIYGARRTLLSESGKVLLKFKKHWTMTKTIAIFSQKTIGLSEESKVMPFRMPSKDHFLDLSESVWIDLKRAISLEENTSLCSKT